MFKHATLLTLLLVAALPLAAQRPGRGGHASQRGMGAPVFACLELTENQKIQMKSITEKHQATMEAKRKAAQEATQALHRASRTAATSEADLKALHDRASAARFELMQARRAMQQEHRAVLTADQLVNMEKYQAERQERMKNGAFGRGHRKGSRPGMGPGPR